jgi:hypothetical protein
MRQEQRSVPAVVFDHVVEFNDVLPLFVLLAALKGLLLKGGEGPSSWSKSFTTGIEVGQWLGGAPFYI